METKFSVLRRALEQQLRLCEMALVASRQKLKSKEDQEQSLLEEFYALEIPDSGNSRLFVQAYEEKGVYLGMIEVCKRGIADLKQEILRQEGEYRKKCLEFEKIELLHQRELKALEEKEKIRERKELDELAVLQFAQKARMKEEA